MHYERYGPEANLTIGENVRIGEGSLINCNAAVTLGDHVMLGHRVMLLAGGHDYRQLGADRIESTITKDVSITVEEGVWICSGAIIVGPCHIGKDAVIAAGAVVQGKVEPGALVVGNPGRMIGSVNSKIL